LYRLIGLLACHRGGKKRQRDIIGQSPHGPQRRASIETERAECIRIREQNQSPLGQRSVTCEIFQRYEWFFVRAVTIR